MTINNEVIQRSRARGPISGEQVGSCGGTASWWFDVGWGDGNSTMVDAWTNWSFCKISGSDTNFFVDTSGTAYSTQDWPWRMTRFEPWLRSNTSAARLRDRSPAGRVDVYDESISFNFGLSYNGGSAGVSFKPKKNHYNPYITSYGTLYSLEWRGDTGRNVSVANGHVTRWSGGHPNGMQMANCGGGYSQWDGAGYQWGNCSQR
ncbi:MAG TPA: hypothetical protein VFZ66_13250 [Herpetosiphonaceae bacterium]